MATSAPTPLRQALEERVRQLVVDTETLFTEARERSRREMADQLNQAVRRIRQAGNLEDLGATLVDASGPFCTSAALFGVSGDFLNGERVRGVSASAAKDFGVLEIGRSDAPALVAAMESHDPVITVATAAEVSKEVARLFEHNAASRAAIYPLVARDGVPALLYTWGSTQGPAVELLVQAASLVWTWLTEPEAVEVAPAAPATGLISIAGVSAPAAAPKTSSWDELPVEEQRVHLQAQRFARVQVAEMRLFESEAVQSGRMDWNLYGELRERIDGARENYRKSFFACPSMVDYLHLELVRTLGNDKPELLGKEYPGPLV